MSEVSGSFYNTMLSAVKTGGAEDENSGYRDDYDSSLATALADSLDISEEEAQSFVDIAQAAAGGGEATIENVLNEILELLHLDEDSDEEDIDFDNLDFSEFVVDAFEDIASGEGVFLEEDAGELSEMLGIEEGEAVALIQVTGGEFGQMTKLLFDDDQDGEVSFEELTKDQSTLMENIDAIKGVMEGFDGYSYGDHSFGVNEDGTIPESGHIAQASIEDGKAAMAQFLTDNLGFEEDDASDLIGTLEEDGLLTFDEESGTVGNHAFIQFKSIIAEYSMKTDDLGDADGDEKKEEFMASANAAKTALEDEHGGDWSDSSTDATEEMISQIDEYYQGQMTIMENMSSNIQSAADMTASLASGIGDISVGDGGGEASGGGMPA